MAGRGALGRKRPKGDLQLWLFNGIEAIRLEAPSFAPPSNVVAYGLNRSNFSRNVTPASIQVLNRVVQMRPDSKKPQATAMSYSETLCLKE